MADGTAALSTYLRKGDVVVVMVMKCAAFERV